MKTVLILSGGLDSTTLLYRLLREGKEVLAISFDYGQKHRIELEMAKKTCEKLNVSHKIIEVPFLKEISKTSALTSDIEVPEGHYEAENMKTTVVPARNLIFASIATAYAINNDCDQIALGVHAGDHAIYADCRPGFIAALSTTAYLSDDKHMSVSAPYLYMNKGQIVEEGELMKVDYALTWTCYKGEEKPCGKCGSCQERIEAFKFANAIDPLMMI